MKKTLFTFALTVIVGFTGLNIAEARMGGMVSRGSGMFSNNNYQVRYNSFDVDLSDDVFVNPTRFMQVTDGMDFVDENSDGIIDYVQDSSSFVSLNLGDFVDENGDTIHDAFQTNSFYGQMGMYNFVDVNGDGICDNYSTNIRMDQRSNYMGFDVDVSQDIFVNPTRFSQVAGGLAFIDDDGDGICDYAQNTQSFDSLGFGNFIDENGDTIHDAFQTNSFYGQMGMYNFVDVNGDGICDNYAY